jgi:glycosyltransferase involved in cell wall biosynthesis
MQEAVGGKGLPLTVVLLTYNEELNLAACLESMKGCARQIIVVDSGSTDRTVEIARQYGAEVFSHAFETHARQWNWALENLPISGEWILALDADQRLTPELAEEIAGLVDDDLMAAGINGFYIKRRQIFRGKWIRHGGYYPKYLLKLFRRGAALADACDLVDHHFNVRGKVARLQNDLVEDNRNEAEISVWIAKHNRYARLQAFEHLNRQRHHSLADLSPLFASAPDERTRWLKAFWNRLPLFIRPLFYFVYRYFFRLGFLDGKQGFIFHFLQAFWYRLLVDINIDELRGKGIATDTSYEEAPTGKEAAAHE